MLNACDARNLAARFLVTLLATAYTVRPDRIVYPETLNRAGFDITGVNDAPPPPGATSQTDGSPSIFTALQQELGLRLDPGKAPVKFIVVDHMDKVPVPN